MQILVPCTLTTFILEMSHHIRSHNQGHASVVFSIRNNQGEYLVTSFNAGLSTRELQINANVAKERDLSAGDTNYLQEFVNRLNDTTAEMLLEERF